MKGHLHLVCGRGGSGLPCLKEQSFSAPFHLSKPHLDADALVVNVVNPTAGLFDGDEVVLDAKVESGVSLVLTTPSASRVYQSRSGKAALVTQRVHVAKGAFAEFVPEPLIPHAGSVYQQSTELQVDPGGGLIFFEWLAPGRVASGESFLFDQLEWKTDVRFGSQLVVRERYHLKKDDVSLTPLQTVFPVSHYLGCFIIGDFVFPVEEVEALGSESVYLGWSRLTAGGWSIKVLCADSLPTRQTLTQLRTILYRAMGRAVPTLGRY